MNHESPKKRGRPRKTVDGLHGQTDRFFQQFAKLPFSEKEEMVLNGITVKYLADLITFLRMDGALMERLLLLDSGELAPMKEEDKFGPVVSDRIMAILELYSYGVDSMGEFELFNEWMKRPSEKFVFHRPIDVINTHPGLLEVRQALHEIRTGYY
ncbi:antitoxin Xre/MbcA/ParS toxin-binding domain-containing protein [Chitinophaga sp. NPDC101104]|uniref:antitoxin Xre/MbcA/ParS toxin-binding domain-containing protein n=1 Tax=Chitinophaga sp. NPDC101104 TaxID=3390561 RepID=UPI003D01E065